MTANLPISSSVIANSITCLHPAMMPFLVQSNPNGESTNKSPVPCLPVSWNRSSSNFPNQFTTAVPDHAARMTRGDITEAVGVAVLALSIAACVMIWYF
jgi:hypothetical protein